MLPKTIPNKLPGTVLPQYVRCGKSGCKCARGELHGPYWYRFWHQDGYKLRKEYVRKADLEAVRAACRAYADETQEGRVIIKRGRRILQWMSNAGVDSSPERAPFDLLRHPDTLQHLLQYAGGEKGSLALQIRAIHLLLRAPGSLQAHDQIAAEDLLCR